MFHKAIKLEFKEGTALQLTFQDGKVKRFDMAVLFDKYPQLLALRNRALFTSGRLAGYYGIIWNDDLDIEAETLYEDGETVRCRGACRKGAFAKRAVRLDRNRSIRSFQNRAGNRKSFCQHPESHRAGAGRNPSRLHFLTLFCAAPHSNQPASIKCLCIYTRA